MNLVFAHRFQCFSIKCFRILHGLLRSFGRINQSVCLFGSENKAVHRPAKGPAFIVYAGGWAGKNKGEGGSHANFSTVQGGS